MDDDSKWRLLYLKKLETEVVHAFSFLRDAGIEPILIKGWAAARNYPKDVERFYADVDLAVSASDFDLAKRLLRTEPGNKLGIDVHRELRHLDTRPWNEIYSNSQEIRLNDVMIRVPSDEDHLRIMAVHWLNDGGARKDRLWDIYYAVKNRPAGFDWDICLNSVGEIRREWIIATIGLAHKYLELEIDGLPFADQARNIPPWLVRALEKEWQSGMPLRSMHISLDDPKELFQQIKKRIPPNAIQATVEMEGRFDNRSRLRYQVGSIIRKFRPSFSGIRDTIVKKSEVKYRIRRPGGTGD